MESDERQTLKAADPCSRDALLEIYGTARSLEGDFEEEVLKVLAKGREFSSNVKRVVRARQKTATKYRGDYTRLRDVLRGSIICGDVEDFSACAEGLKALGTAGVVDVVSIKNRLRRKDQAGNGPAAGGYVDVNVIVRFKGFLAEVQLHLAPIVKIKKEAHVAYEVGRGLGLMGALGEADGTKMRPRAVHNVARVVPLMMCLFFGILYFDAFVLKGAPLLVKRVTTLPATGVLLRLYGIVLAAPYFAISYMLVRATGAFGTKARPPKTRIALLYEENFGYEGKYFAWKVAVFQLCEVALQVIAKFPMWLAYKREISGAYSIYMIYNVAVFVNVLYPPLLLRSPDRRFQRDATFVLDSLLDVVYATIPFMFLCIRVRGQPYLIPHDPITYASNLVPILHIYFVIGTLEEAAGRRDAPARTAPAPVGAREPSTEAAPPCPSDKKSAKEWFRYHLSDGDGTDGRLPLWACFVTVVLQQRWHSVGVALPRLRSRVGRFHLRRVLGRHVAPANIESTHPSGSFEPGRGRPDLSRRVQRDAATDPHPEMNALRAKLGTQ